MIGRIAGVAVAVLGGLAFQESPPKLEVVRSPQCDGGTTSRIDLARVERNHREAADAVKRALSGFEKVAVSRLEVGHDAGLPDAKGKNRFVWRPTTPLPEALRGVTIHVVTVERDGKVVGLPRGGRVKGDVVLISRAVRLRDCAPLAPVTLLTRELATTLRMRTSRGRCVVSHDGREVDVIEGDEK